MSRNWKWFVPLSAIGCFSLIAGVVLLIVSLVFGVMKSAEPYKESVARAVANPEVQAALGTPVKPGFFLTGSINTSGTSGNASLAIPLSGPKGKATLHVEGIRTTGAWTYPVMDVVIPGRTERIHLSPGTP